MFADTALVTNVRIIICTRWPVHILQCYHLYALYTVTVCIIC